MSNVVNIKNRKGRDRIDRGHLQSFSDLPFCTQQVFKNIAVEIEEIADDKPDLFVYGSYYWGYWDKDSDYDVRAHVKEFPMEQSVFKEYIQNKLGVNADIMIMVEPKKKMNLIRIPV